MAHRTYTNNSSARAKVSEYLSPIQPKGEQGCAIRKTNGWWTEKMTVAVNKPFFLIHQFMGSINLIPFAPLKRLTVCLFIWGSRWNRVVLSICSSLVILPPWLVCHFQTINNEMRMMVVVMVLMTMTMTVTMSTSWKFTTCLTLYEAISTLTPLYLRHEGVSKSRFPFCSTPPSSGHAMAPSWCFIHMLPLLIPATIMPLMWHLDLGPTFAKCTVLSSR